MEPSPKRQQIGRDTERASCPVKVVALIRAAISAEGSLDPGFVLALMFSSMKQELSNFLKASLSVKDWPRVVRLSPLILISDTQ